MSSYTVLTKRWVGLNLSNVWKIQRVPFILNYRQNYVGLILNGFVKNSMHLLQRLIRPAAQPFSWDRCFFLLRICEFLKLALKFESNGGVLFSSRRLCRLETGKSEQLIFYRHMGRNVKKEQYWVNHFCFAIAQPIDKLYLTDRVREDSNDI